MRGTITTFWGKLGEELGPAREWHPLLDHCADVAACTEALLTDTLLGERLASWGGLRALDGVQVARLSVISALHDLGKFNYGFQSKSGESPRGVLPCGHVREILALFGDGYEELQAQLLRVLPTATLETWADDDAACKLLVAAIGHHGRPYPCERPPHFNAKVWDAGRAGDPFAGIAGLVAATRRWFPEAFASGGTMLPATASFQHGFAGLVMLADWLGSHCGFFPYSDSVDDDRMTFARAQAGMALREVGLDTRGSRQALGSGRPGFSAISGYPVPQPVQEAVGALPLEPGGSLTILESETGSGKTEAALLRYVQLFQAGLVDGLYFALPTRTAATQIHERVVTAVKLAFPEHERPPVLLAVPGYLRIDDREGKHLPGFKVLWNDDPAGRMRYRGWAAENSKRYLAGAVVVGTIDQVLLSTVMTSHAHLRATAAARHLLVVDEVHASDAYMNRLLEEVLRFHLQAGGHAFLMSATLGASARVRLLAAVGSQVPLPSMEEASCLPYPMITHHRAGHPRAPIAVAHGQRTRRICPQLLAIADDPAAIARQALAAARQGARVLVVRNLVRTCVATQEALEDSARASGDEHLLFRAGDVVAPHHSRFARKDRSLLDSAVEAHFGKHRPSGRGCVLVATQTVEQSLDLDADLLLTDLCPMDVLLQRLGRLHRHARPAHERPSSHQTPTVGVLVPSLRDLGAALHESGKPCGPHGYGTVYGDLRVLEATWRACEGRAAFEIPADNRQLVESTTHPEALDAIARELGGRWASHFTWIQGSSATDRRVARNIMVDRAVPFGEAKFLDKKEVGKVSSRLGDDDRRVTFTKHHISPFGQRIEGLVLPHHMLRGSPADPLAPVIAKASAAAITFRYGDATYRYDRLGLRPDSGLTNIDREGEELS